MNQTAQSGKTLQQIAKEKAREENREVRTIREAHIMMLLRHPNIVKMKDITPHGPYFYILMDYVNGGQLLHYIVKRQRLSDRRTRHFTRQIVSALDYLHRNSIVHRDLKIENIMVDKSGRNIKIIDFGLSNLFCPERQLTTYCGSLYFAAPELLKATPYNGPEVDIWSLGVVIYVMATGAVPFDDKSMPGLHEKIKNGHVTYPAHLTEECKDLLSRIFITDPARRIIMTDIIHHPWLNKEAAPINSHMPIRKPLTLPLSPKVIERMAQGFNLGSPEEIERRLTLIIESPVYHSAMTHIADCHARKPSSTHLHDLNSYIVYDDPQSVPAAYHPFISLYYLASEKLAAIEHEVHHHRLSIRNSLSRKASIESLGGNSSARSSQTSLVGGEDGPRQLIDVPTSQTPVIPQIINPGGKFGGNGSSVGFEPAGISSTNYLHRIQRWLRSSLSQHHLSADTTPSAPPSPPQKMNDDNVSQQELATERLPTPSVSIDDKAVQVTRNTSVSSQSTVAETNLQPATNGGSKSLFRKLSKAFLRKNSTKTLNKKSSNLSTTVSDSNTSDENVSVHAETAPIVEEAPPPLPPKDYNISYMTPPSQQRNSQQLPPGMSMATVTSRQTAHTIDISAIQQGVTTNHIPTPIASKMSKYEAAPATPIPTRSSSTSFQHRRRGSISKLTGKMNTWLNRSTSLNQHSKLNKTEA